MGVIPRELIQRAKKCDCKVCRTLVGSSHYNSEVLNGVSPFDAAEDERKRKQRETGKHTVTK